MVDINSVKVQQGTTNSQLQNVTINGNITFGFLSNIEINEFVNLTNATIDIPYSNVRNMEFNAMISGFVKNCIKKNFH